MTLSREKCLREEAEFRCIRGTLEDRRNEEKGSVGINIGPKCIATLSLILGR